MWQCTRTQTLFPHIKLPSRCPQLPQHHPPSFATNEAISRGCFLFVLSFVLAIKAFIPLCVFDTAQRLSICR